MALGQGFDEVLAAAQVGAGWAFTRLYEDLAPVVAGYLRSRGVADVEDATSEVFLGVFRNIASFTGEEERFRSWIFTIAHRRLLDDRRRRSRRAPTVPLDRSVQEPPAGDVEGEALARLGDLRVRELLATLTPDQRDVLLLRIVGDLTVEQAAQVLGKRPGAVKQLQRRALDALRREVASEGITL